MRTDHPRWGRALLAGLLLVAAPATATTAPELLAQRKSLDDGPRHWRDRERHMRLDLFAREGAEPEHRALTTYERQRPGDEQQTILFFEAPASVKGLGFLSYGHPGRADEQWVYLPALKRARQIGTSREDREAQFVGTDLTYQDLELLRDMTGWSEMEAPSTLEGEEVIDGAATYRIGRTIKRDDVTYSRVRLWLRKDDLVTRRVEFFKDGPDAVKRIDETDVRLVNGIPIAHRVEVVTLPARSRTVMIVDQVRLDQDFGDDLFSQRTLQRGKR